MIECICHCKENRTILRYFDLREIVHFVDYINEKNYMDVEYGIDRYFGGDIQNITMNSLKEYYLDLMLHVDKDKWHTVYKYMLQMRKLKIGGISGGVGGGGGGGNGGGLLKTRSVDAVTAAAAVGSNKNGQHITKTNSVSYAVEIKQPVATVTGGSGGILLTTSDAYTLTDGPTIYLAEDVNKIGSFYIQQSKIATSVFQNILSKIITNSKLLKNIEELEGMINVKETKTGDDGKNIDLLKLYNFIIIK